jgi:hypothetical protein
MATVYLCLDSRTGSRVAVKVLREEIGSAVVVERFLREIAFASELDHPRIPKVLDSGVNGAVPFYVMTYVDGESLRQRLDRVKQLTVEEAVRIALAVTEPMTYAHASGLVHRDIKPGNILLGADSVYVLDFGIARAIIASADERLTSTGVAVGTPAYMSPEQALADGDLDARSDVYSLGCVMYEMLAGIPPFVGATPQAVMARRFGSPPPPLGETREGIPPHVEHAVAKALCRAPADRWQSAAELAHALTDPNAPESVQHVRVQVDGRRRTYGRVLAGVIAAALLGAGAYAVSTLTREPLERAVADIEEWDFMSAERTLRDATAQNPADPAIQLWLAHVMSVRGAPQSDWRPYALRAADGARSLDSLDAMRATVLAGDGRHSHESCDRWIPIAADNQDVARNIVSNLSLADCLANDDAVIADAASPSGFRFRASHHQAAGLYEGLLTRNAERGATYAVVMPRLMEVLRTLKNDIRVGMTESDEPDFFAAFQSLISDTLAYFPYPIDRSGAPIRARDPAGLDRAIQQNRLRLKPHAVTWARVSPRDPDAHETLGIILERTEELAGSDGSAIAHIGEARRLSLAESDSSGSAYLRNLRLAVAEVRLLLKLQRFPEAGRLADSALAWPVRAGTDSVAPAADSMLIGLAALTGRPSRLLTIDARYAADYRVSVPSVSTNTLPPEVGAEAHRLSDFSAVGGPADSIVAVADRLLLKLESLYPASQLPKVRIAVLRRPLSLATPTIGPGLLASLGETADPFGKAARALASGNLRQARRYADSLDAVYADMAPGELTMDAVFLKAWLLTAVGDTAAAVQLLDNSFLGLSKMPANTLRDAAIAAALVRAIILRAEIAWKQNDTGSAGKWSQAAQALWGRGDPEVRSRISALVAGR